MDIFCISCGTRNEEDALFCQNCGKSLSEAEIRQEVVTKSSNRTPPPHNPNYFRTPASQDNQSGYFNNRFHNQSYPTHISGLMRKDPTIAVFLSIFVPGFSRIYVSKYLEGLIITIAVFLAWIYLFGVFVHLYYVFTASGYIKRFNQGNGFPE